MATENNLRLSLKKAAFDVMVTGEKKIEYRKGSKWMKSRLFNKDGSRKEYDNVIFTNGYKSDSPFFIANYQGFEIEKDGWDNNTPYSNGLVVGRVEVGDFKIRLGSVFFTGNLD